MTWDYWMDLQVWKERSTALRKIKGTQARKIDLFQKFFIFGFFALLFLLSLSVKENLIRYMVSFFL